MAEDFSLPNMNQLAAGLYVVATPIGNLRDITLRALDTLTSVDLIACEDTRHTRNLLSHYGINKTLIAYHDHSGPSKRGKILEKIQQGGSVALVSDAGTPLVSDPGYKLVRDAVEQGLPVIPIPGASSILAGLIGSGTATDAFCFAGFPPQKQKARCDFFTKWARVPTTLIFLESAKRLPQSLSDLAKTLATTQAAASEGRRVTVARELTKLHEEFRHGLASDLAAFYEENGAPKGEVVLILDPPAADANASDEEIDTFLQSLLDDGASVRDASDQAAEMLRIKKREAYQRALALSRQA